jgi:hypothetical protein
LPYRFVSTQSFEGQGLNSGSMSAICEMSLGMFASRGCLDKELLTEEKLN